MDLLIYNTAAQDAPLAKIRRTLSVYWAERCVLALVAASEKDDKALRDYLDSSSAEKISAVVMADFLSVRDPLTQRSDALVTHIYDQLDSPEHVASCIAYVKAKANANAEDLVVAAAVHATIARNVVHLREECSVWKAGD
ncbi:hypothetical protein PI124_g406 [Phytophthora idaei]|nr:hypothetical protein PI124_g406 [Phytophthora idaei]